MTGRQLRRARKAASVQQQDLARALGVSGGHLCQIELGRIALPAGFAIRYRAMLQTVRRERDLARRQAIKTQRPLARLAGFVNQQAGGA